VRQCTTVTGPETRSTPFKSRTGGSTFKNPPGNTPMRGGSFSGRNHVLMAQHRLRVLRAISRQFAGPRSPTWRMLDPSSTPSATAITSRVLRLDQTAFDTSGFRQLGLRLPSLRPIFSMRRQIRVREHAGLQRPAEAWPAPSRSSRCQTARFAAWFRAARLVPATRLCVRVLLPFLFISAASPLPLSTLRWACARNLGVSSRSDPEPRGRRSAGRRTA